MKQNEFEITPEWGAAPREFAPLPPEAEKPAADTMPPEYTAPPPEHSGEPAPAHRSAAQPPRAGKAAPRRDSAQRQKLQRMFRYVSMTVASAVVVTTASVCSDGTFLPGLAQGALTVYAAFDTPISAGANAELPPEPTVAPTVTPAPTATTTPRPTAAPTATPAPTAPPTATPKPTPKPTAAPTPEPPAAPVAAPPPEPTAVPTAIPTPEPTLEPTPEPTAEPTPEPTAKPTPEPTATSTPAPTPTETPDTSGDEPPSDGGPSSGAVLFEAGKDNPLPVCANCGKKNYMVGWWVTEEQHWYWCWYCLHFVGEKHTDVNEDGVCDICGFDYRQGDGTADPTPTPTKELTLTPMAPSK